jgi:fucose permease
MKAVIHLFIGSMTILIGLLVVYVVISVLFPPAGDKVVQELGELSSVVGNMIG